MASGALIVDDYEDTEVGSPPGDPRKLKLGEGQVLLPVQGPASITFLPPEEDEMRRLSQLRADDLADYWQTTLESLCSSADTVGVAQAGGGARGACCLCS